MCGMKQPMELICDEKSRRVTFNKRKGGLMKKMFEFSTLCGVEACMIIYGPKEGDRPALLETWPTNPDRVRSVIDTYRDLAMEKKKTSNLSDFLKDRQKKKEDELAKAHKRNPEADKFPTWDKRIEGLSKDELGFLHGVLDKKIEAVNTCIGLIKENQRLTLERAALTEIMGCSHVDAKPLSNSFGMPSLFHGNVGFNYPQPISLLHPWAQPISTFGNGTPQNLMFNNHPWPSMPPQLQWPVMHAPQANDYYNLGDYELNQWASYY